MDIHKRYIQHKNRYAILNGESAPTEDSYFHAALREYGFENFEFEILEECSIDELDEKECWYVQREKTCFPFGYNKTQGGRSGHVNRFESFEDVLEIKKLLRTTTMSNIEIGNMFGVTDQTISDINSGRTWFDKEMEYPIRSGAKALSDRMHLLSKDKEKKCKLCGIKLQKKNKTGLCRLCLNKAKAGTRGRPTKDELYNLLLKNSFEAVGKMYGVTGGAVRRWCKSFNIPFHARDYKEIKNAGVVQSEESRPCKAKVEGSSPSASSMEASTHFKL